MGQAGRRRKRRDGVEHSNTLGGAGHVGASDVLGDMPLRALAQVA
jgi:hypothetical protein